MDSSRISNLQDWLSLDFQMSNSWNNPDQGDNDNEPIGFTDWNRDETIFIVRK